MKVLFVIILAILSAGCLNEVGAPKGLTTLPHERTPIADLEPNLRMEVIKGMAIMNDRNLGRNNISCGSCHPNPELNSVWPSLFPRRWASTINPTHRVITLAQHNYGAYKDMMKGDLSPEADEFNALNTYLYWLGDGTVIWGEPTPGQFQVDEASQRGRELFNNMIAGRLSCSSCHSEISMVGIASTFPKYNERYERVVILDTFLFLHARDKQGWDLYPDSSEMGYLASFLTNESRGYVLSLARA